MSEFSRAKLLREPAEPNRLAAAIKLAGKSQREVAEALEINEPHLSNICNGRVENITLPTLRKFADYFGCYIEDLFPERAA